MPHHAVDPVPVAFEIGLALQTMVTRQIDIFDPVVLTFAKIAAGTANNVIPESARDDRHIAHDLRKGARAGRRRASAGSRQISPRRISAQRRSTIRRGYPVTVNDPALSISRAASRPSCSAPTITSAVPAPIMGAEDFSYVLQRMPGCMMFLGVRPTGSTTTACRAVPLQPHDPERGRDGGRHRDARRGRPPLPDRTAAGLEARSACGSCPISRGARAQRWPERSGGSAATVRGRPGFLPPAAARRCSIAGRPPP